MKSRWVFPILLLCLAAFWWILTPPQGASQVRPQASITPSAPKTEALKRHPAQQVTAAAPLVLAPSVSPRKPEPVLRLDEADRHVDPTRPPLQQHGRRWNFVAGVVAIPHGAPGTANIPVRSSLGGFDVIGEGDAPANVETYSLVQREDNGLLGIFTGTIKAVGEKGPQGGFLSDCPGAVVRDTYPLLKSYLLRASDAQGGQAFFDCLTTSGRFKRVEWEILDHPSTHR